MNNYEVLNNKTTYKSKYLNEEIYNLLDYTFEINSDFAFDVIEVTSNYIARPDLLSYDIYGSDEYVDVICKINGISNPFELNEGDILIIPNIANMRDFLVKPTILETDDENKSKPQAKKKNEKRKPNESIIGDKRFNIDVKNRIIIY